jgi:hypothetical protein
MASISWAYFVNFTVDGQRPLDLPRPHRSIASAHSLVFPIRAVPLNMVPYVRSREALLCLLAHARVTSLDFPFALPKI